MNFFNTFNKQWNDMRPLNAIQKKGVAEYGLKEQEVRSRHFGQHTLYAMRHVLRKRRAANSQEAFNMVQGLKEHQAMGIVYGLNQRQVTSPNFMPHTISEMQILMKQDRAVNYRKAYDIVRDLNVDQAQGVLSYGLNRNQVTVPNFGKHTIKALSQLNRRGMNIEQAYRTISGLKARQTKGLVRFGLSRNQVTAPNFGRHTLDGIIELQNRAIHNQDINFTYENAFRELEGLRHTQVEGVVHFGLNRGQVQTPDFGRHTLDGMIELQNRAIQNQDINFTYENAFRELERLRHIQVKGVVHFGLDREQVQMLNFDTYSLLGIQKLVNQQRANDHQEAFQILRELNDFQVEGIVDYGLNREQVTNPDFNRISFNVMRALRAANPKAEGQHVYEVAGRMQEYQVRALLENRLTTENIGIGMTGNTFIVNDPQTMGVSAATVDAHSHLMAVENLADQEAFARASTLNSTQVIGMIDFGLSLEQVESSYFENTENVLTQLAEALNDRLKETDFELSIPLEGEQREQLRETFEVMRTSKDNKEAETFERDENKGQYHKQRNSEGSNVLESFLEYAKPKDILNILGRLESSAEDTNRKEVRPAQETPDQTTAMESLQHLAQRPASANRINRHVQRQKNATQKKSRKPKL